MNFANNLGNANEMQGEEFYDNLPKIRVVVRKRPLNRKEIQKNDADIIEIRRPQTVIVREMKTKVDLTKYIEEHFFNFDYAFDEGTTNENLYYETVRPLVEAAFGRAKVTCFAYGQTGSGKTYTMMGDIEGNEIKVPGLYLLAAYDIFKILQQNEFGHLSIWISFYEIYCGKLYDLLNDRQQLHAREDAKQNVNIVGLQEKRVNGVQSLMQIIEFGSSVRITGVTGANMDSSRSHAILQISLKDNHNKIHGKISFIDLAGSERGADVVDSNKQTRIDGAEINKSLLALKECIRALDQDKRHTPFRGSKLTLVLKDSFTGNCRTLMIGNISPCTTSCEHTLNTLRYADRVKELKKPTNTELNSQLTSLDQLSKQLMLPRQDKNTIKLLVNKENPTQFIFPQKNNPPPLQKNNSANRTNNFNINNYNLNNNNNPMNNNNNNRFFLDELGISPTYEHPRPYTAQPKMSQPINLLPASSKNNKPGQQPPFNAFNNNFEQNNMMNVNINPPMPYNQPNAYPHPQPQDKPRSFSNMNNNLMAGPNNYNNNNNNNQLMNQQANINLEQIKNWTAKNEEDLQLMSQKHEQLIGTILSEEEEVISSHRQHIDDMVELIKQEMLLLHEVDKPGSDVDEYVDNLDALLTHKLEIISILKSRLVQFKEHLKEEELLSKKFYEQRSAMLDVFDLNSGGNVGTNEDLQLLEDLPNFNN